MLPMTETVKRRRGTPRDMSRAQAARWGVRARIDAAMRALESLAHRLSDADRAALRGIADQEVRHGA